MDYLTILSTRSLILFPHPTAGHYGSPVSSPTTPTPASTSPKPRLLLPPSPIAIPVSSILYSDNDTAYFLVHHVLSSNASSVPNSSSAKGGVQGKEATAEAEVMAWREVDRARMCVLALGQWFAHTHPGRAGMDEAELQQIAAQYGVGIKALDSGMRVDGESHDEQGEEAGYVSLGGDVEKGVEAMDISSAGGEGGRVGRSRRFRDEHHVHVGHGHDDASAHSHATVIMA
ncbi:hypothetical protein IAT38_005175 [Cryptococcus sp. DSM 104549]